MRPLLDAAFESETKGMMQSDSGGYAGNWQDTVAGHSGGRHHYRTIRMQQPIKVPFRSAQDWSAG